MASPGPVGPSCGPWKDDLQFRYMGFNCTQMAQFGASKPDEWYCDPQNTLQGLYTHDGVYYNGETFPGAVMPVGPPPSQAC